MSIMISWITEGEDPNGFERAVGVRHNRWAFCFGWGYDKELPLGLLPHRVVKHTQAANGKVWREIAWGWLGFFLTRGRVLD